MKESAGSSDQSEDDNDEDPLVVIDKSMKSCLARQMAGLDRNLGSL